jgi:hypothetical protein
MSTSRTFIPCITVTPDRTSAYNYYPDRTIRKYSWTDLLPDSKPIEIINDVDVIHDNISNAPGNYSTVVTEAQKRKDNRSISRLRNAIYFLMITSPFHRVYCKKEKRHFTFKLNFITLTLSAEQQHDDYYIKNKMLDVFLKWMKRKGANNYVWRAETQANGRIHFHITTNCYIHWRSIRDKWNSIQQVHSYLNTYFDTFHSLDPNSTDVKAVKNEGKAIRYIAKYMGKVAPGRREIQGHSFGYSQPLSNPKFVFTAHEDSFRIVGDYIRKMTTATVKHDFIQMYYTHPLYNWQECEPLKKAIENHLNKGLLDN